MKYWDVPRADQGRPTKVIAVINQKGGVGKSTTAINLSCALGKLGKKVLIVDFDPQGNSTSGYGIDKENLDQDIYDSMMNNVAAADLIMETCDETVFVLPATIQLAGAEIELVTAMAREMRLKEVIAPIKDQFDYVFVDCPPSLGLLTINALTASTDVLIPIQCEYYALEGVTKLMESMRMVQDRINPELRVFGVLMTMFDARTSLSNQVVEEVRKHFGDQVFTSVIPRTVRISEAPSYGMPVLDYEPGNKGAQAYADLAEEVAKRG